MDLCLGLSRGDAPGGFKRVASAEPVRAFQCGVFHCIETAQGSAPVNDPCLEEAVYRPGQGSVKAVANAADRQFRVTTDAI